MWHVGKYSIAERNQAIKVAVSIELTRFTVTRGIENLAEYTFHP